MRRKKIKLNKELFWDVNYNQVDFNKNADFVINRVLLFGDLDDFKKIRNYYNLNRIKKAAKNSKIFDKKSLNFWSIVLHIPKNKFVCLKTF